MAVTSSLLLLCYFLIDPRPGFFRALIAHKFQFSQLAVHKLQLPVDLHADTGLYRQPDRP